MSLNINKINSVTGIDSVVYLISDSKYISTDFLSGSELKYIEKQKNKFDKDLICFNRVNKLIFIQFIRTEKDKPQLLELLRKSGDKIAQSLNEHNLKKVTISDIEGNTEEALTLAEGIALGNYQFLIYKKKEVEKNKNVLQQINIFSKKLDEQELEKLSVIIEATCFCRDLVNHPFSYLNAAALSDEIKKACADTGVKTEIMTKKKIESLKMGGLLAVNKGSIDPPTFTIMEWKPDGYFNEKPVVLVGKGVVYDTGGMNIKIQDHMNDMKSDMAGAAAVASAIYAIAKMKLPVYVVGLIPATDNRLCGNAIVPGDVINMYDGSTVEVINTDAEGRLILADALGYAKKYDPELVINIATLTGSAKRAIGKYGIAAMQSKAEKHLKNLKISGDLVNERLAEFPLWDDYAEEIKSEIADIKNLGGVNAGTITAGKFLEYFTDFPFIHLDIAGCAVNDKRNSYQGKGGSGVGTRLFIDFIKNNFRAES